jgi:hypothetical protein
VIADSPHPFAMMNVRDVREAVAYPNILPLKLLASSHNLFGDWVVAN